MTRVLLLFGLVLLSLSGQSDEDAQREVLAIGVAKDKFSEVKGFICCLGAECLLDYGLSKDRRISV